MEYCPFILFQNLTMPCEISKDRWIGNRKFIYKNSSLPISFLSTKERIFTMRIWGTNYTIPNSMEKKLFVMSRKFLCFQIEKVFQYTTYIPNLYDIISSLLLYNYGKSLRPSDFMPFPHLLVIWILDIRTYLNKDDNIHKSEALKR